MSCDIVTSIIDDTHSPGNEAAIRVVAGLIAVTGQREKYY